MIEQFFEKDFLERLCLLAVNTGIAPTCNLMIKIVKVDKKYLNSLLVNDV